MLFAAEKTFHDPRPFGRALGLSEGTIQDIMRDYPNNSREERTQMLTQWIEDKGETATAHRLIEVILSSDAGCLDDAATAELLWPEAQRTGATNQGEVRQVINYCLPSHTNTLNV